MLIDKPTKIKIVKEHLNDGITLKELKEKYGISNEHIKYMIACGLNNLQKIKDGEPLGSRASAESYFGSSDADFLD